MIATLTPLLSLFLSGIFLWMGHGLLLTFLPITGSALNFSDWQVGLTGSFYFLGFISGCFVTPHILRRVGHIRTYAVLAALYTGIALALNFTPLLLGWLVIRFVIGMSISGLYMIFESWLNAHCQPTNRGSVLAVYSVVNLLMIAAGQQLLNLPFDYIGLPYTLAALLFAFSIIPVSLTQASAPPLLEKVKVDIKKVWRHSQVGLLGALVAGLVTGAYWAMTPIYGKSIGMDNAAIAWFMSASVLGGALFQFPLGRLSDRLDRRIVLQCLALVAALCCLLIFVCSARFVDTPALLIVLAFLWGGTCMTIYAISLAHANDAAQANDFVEISSSMLITLGGSSAIGASFASVVMDFVGPGGLYVFMLGPLICFIAVVQLRRKHVVLPERPETHEDFQPLPGMTTPVIYELDPRGEELDGSSHKESALTVQKNTS